MFKKKIKMQWKKIVSFPNTLPEGINHCQTQKKIESLTEILSFITSRFYARIQLLDNEKEL